jgi:hypothetical protein
MVREIEALQVQLVDPSGQILLPVMPGGPAWPGTSQAGATAHILYYSVAATPDATWRLAVTAEWVFPALDRSIQSIQVAIPSPLGPLTVTVPLVPVEAAALPVLGSEGAELVQHGVSLRVAGTTRSSSGLALQVAARGAASSERIVGLGRFEPGQPSPVLGRMLWDSEGHLYADSNALPSVGLSEGDTFLDTLSFPTVSVDVHPATLEVPSIFVVDDTARATVTIPIDGRQLGDSFPVNATFAFGRYPLQIQDAAIRPTAAGRELVADLDLGDVIDGRALLGARAVLVPGRDDVQPRVTSSGATSQHVELHVPLPPDIGPLVTLSFQGTFVEVRGPWKLAVPPAPNDQP